LKHITGTASARALAFIAAFGVAYCTASAQVVFSGAATNSAGIQATVDQFRTSLGTLNPNNGQSFGSGRREVNWDGVPDSFSSPNFMPGNFFNANSPRGVVFSTPGTGLAVSADTSNPTSSPVEFGDIDPSYSGFFAAFSPQRLFTAIGSNIVDVNFFIPGTSAAALTNGFGSVFTSVNMENTTSIEYFDANNQSMGTYFAPGIAGVQENMSFLGVMFDSPVVSRVRITSGNQILAPGNTLQDLVVMDDFIYGEPQAVPEPATMAVLGLGALAIIRRKRKVAQA
jgi:hypothetical protein